MSIFRKNTIKAGDLVIGVKKDGKNSSRSFDEPSIVLEIKELSALVYLEQEGPAWYNLSNIERVYVTEEYEEVDRRSMASIKFVNSDKPRDKNVDGNK